MNTKTKASDRVEELTALIDDKIDALMADIDWVNTLKFMSTQHNYSWQNQFLLWW